MLEEGTKRTTRAHIHIIGTKRWQLINRGRAVELTKQRTILGSSPLPANFSPSRIRAASHQCCDCILIKAGHNGATQGHCCGQECGICQADGGNNAHPGGPHTPHHQAVFRRLGTRSLGRFIQPRQDASAQSAKSILSVCGGVVGPRWRPRAPTTPPRHPPPKAVGMLLSPKFMQIPHFTYKRCDHLVRPAPRTKPYPDDHCYYLLSMAERCYQVSIAALCCSLIWRAVAAWPPPYRHCLMHGPSSTFAPGVVVLVGAGDDDASCVQMRTAAGPQHHLYPC